MSFQQITTLADPAMHRFDLPFSTDRMKLTMAAGSVRLDGVDYPVALQEYTAAPGAKHVRGYIAEHISSGEVILMIDEVEPGEEPFIFEKQEDYRLLFRALSFDMEVSTNDLGDVDISAFHVLPPPPVASRTTPLTDAERAQEQAALDTENAAASAALLFMYEAMIKAGVKLKKTDQQLYDQLKGE